MGFSKAHYICFGLFQAHLVQISSAKGVVEAYVEYWLAQSDIFASLT